MTRNMELIRELLVFFDEKKTSDCVKVPPIAGYDDLTIEYHLLLLHDAGYLQCEPVRSSSSDRVIYVIPFELTWEGHEFLERVRNPNIWNEVMNSVKERGFASASVDFIKQLADAAIRKKLGIK